MKRSLTIGCVLLVGSGVTNCGGSAELGIPGGESGAHAGASGSGVAGGFTGVIEVGVGGAGPYVGVAVEPGGNGGFVGQIGDVPILGTAGAPDIVGDAGAGGWQDESAGAGGDSDQGGTGGSSHVPPAIGVAPQGGAGGGWMGVPPA